MKEEKIPNSIIYTLNPCFSWPRKPSKISYCLQMDSSFISEEKMLVFLPEGSLMIMLHHVDRSWASGWEPAAEPGPWQIGSSTDLDPCQTWQKVQVAFLSHQGAFVITKDHWDELAPRITGQVGTSFPSYFLRGGIHMSYQENMGVSHATRKQSRTRAPNLCHIHLERT